MEMDEVRRNLDRKYGRDEFFRKWVEAIPHVPFDPNWDVRAIPPFGGALVRYIVRMNGARVSIYLDGDNSLGYGPEPAYWEIHPGETGEAVSRYHIDDTDALVRGIESSIAWQIAEAK